MNLFDILGPVMVGPSSSHTAGAVRLGRTARRLLGEGTPRSAAITLYGSFAATGHGHGTDRALIAGLLGFQPDDERIAHSFDRAHDAGMAFTFTLSRTAEEHPNTARIDLVGESGKTLSMIGCSLGGGSAQAVCHAAAIAIKSMLGLVCDPIAGLVEVPCVKRNAAGAMIAMSSADMALAGIRSAVPPDEVILAMREVGDKMDVSLKETGVGGVAGTPFGQKIAEKMGVL